MRMHERSWVSTCASTDLSAYRPIYLPTNDPPIFHLIPIYCIYLSPGLHIHPSISILNDLHLCPCKRRDCSRFVASSCLTCSESLPCKTSKKKGWHSATSGKSGCHPCGIGWCTIASDFFAVHSTLSPPEKILCSQESWRFVAEALRPWPEPALAPNGSGCQLDVLCFRGTMIEPPAQLCSNYVAHTLWPLSKVSPLPMVACHDLWQVPCPISSFFPPTFLLQPSPFAP
jgi:hypothetical protein